jgi:putative PIN family toxin of toxin-antitoxin system
MVLTDQELEKYITRIELHSHLIDISEMMVEVPSDKNDNHVLATLIASGADWLVSGDSDLLNLQKKYNIITPENFVNKFILS